MTTHCSILQHHVLDAEGAGGGSCTDGFRYDEPMSKNLSLSRRRGSSARYQEKSNTKKNNQWLVGRGNARLEGWWAFLSEGVKLRQDNKGRKKERNTPFRSNTWHSVGVAATRKLLQSVSISGSVRKHDRTFLGTLRGTVFFR